MRILITGAAGFISHQLLAELAIQHPQWTLIAGETFVAFLKAQGLSYR